MKLSEQCYKCKNMRTVPGDCHIQCIKPDPLMTGSAHGILHGWFYYPFLFDPIWGEKECINYEKVKE
jgi:hypothetical protein